MTLTGTPLRYTCLGSNSDLVATLGESLHLFDPWVLSSAQLSKNNLQKWRRGFINL